MKVGVAPGHKHTVTQKFGEQTDCFDKADALILQLFVCYFSKLFYLTAKLLADFRGNKHCKGITYIQFIIKLNRTDFNYFIDKFVQNLAV